jgi:ferric-dicitrate binding protein FerR (iron transport regulator)
VESKKGGANSLENAAALKKECANSPENAAALEKECANSPENAAALKKACAWISTRPAVAAWNLVTAAGSQQRRCAPDGTHWIATSLRSSQ